jgi:competence protein ComEA
MNTTTMKKTWIAASLLLALLLGASGAHAAENVPARAARGTATRPAAAPQTDARDDATPAADGGDKAVPVAPTGTVNLNEASEEQLQLLPGVGPAKAAAIVAWRTKHGRFKKLDDLTRVKGFGRKTLQKLRTSLALTGPTTYRGKKNPMGDTAAATPDATP